MKGPSVASAPGYTLTDEHAPLPFGSITWELICLVWPRDSVTWGAPSTAGDVSGLSESRESKEIMNGDFGSVGEMICSLMSQETMRVAMKWRNKRTRVQKRFVHASSLTVSERP